LKNQKVHLLLVVMIVMKKKIKRKKPIVQLNKKLETPKGVVKTQEKPKIESKKIETPKEVVKTITKNSNT